MLELVELESCHLLGDTGQGLYCHFFSYFDGENIKKWCGECGLWVIGPVEEIIDVGEGG